MRGSLSLGTLMRELGMISGIILCSGVFWAVGGGVGCGFYLGFYLFLVTFLVTVFWLMSCCLFLFSSFNKIIFFL